MPSAAASTTWRFRTGLISIVCISEAKISAFDAALNNAKSEWVAANKSMRPAVADQEIYGVKVPRGATFSDFSSQFLKAKADEINAATSVAGRGYMQYAAPQTGGASGSY